MSAILTAAPDLLLEADAITGLSDGASVTTWNDGSGNGRHAGGGVSPVYKAGVAPSGLPAVRFNGSTQYLTSSASTSAAAQTIVAVVNLAGSGNRGVRGISATGGLSLHFTDTSQWDIDKGGVSVIGQSDAKPANGWAMVSIRLGSGTWQMRIDGGDVGGGSTAVALTAGSTTNVGRYSSGGYYWNGDIALLASWSRSLSDSELHDIEVEQSAKWGTAPLTNGAITASTSTAGWPPAALADGVIGTAPNAWAAGAAPTQWVRWQPPSARVATAYTLTARPDDAGAAPRDWTFQGSNNNSTWTTLDTRTGQTFTTGQARTFTTSNSTAYAYYRLNITANTTGGVSVPSFAEWGITYAAVASNVDLTGAVSAATVAAPAGIVSVSRNVALAGLVSALTMAAPAGTFSLGVDVNLTGAVSSVTVAAPAGSLAISGSVNLAGPVAAVTITAPGGGVSAASNVTLTGQLSALNTAAPAGGVTVIGATSATLLGGGTLTVDTIQKPTIVTLSAVTLDGGGRLSTDALVPVKPLTDVTLLGGGTLTARPADTLATDPRTGDDQWRYVLTDLQNVPLAELVDIAHDPVEDGVNEPTTMRFQIAASDPDRALIVPTVTQCQVWQGNRLKVRGPLLRERNSGDNTVCTYQVHDPSWWWRGGRRRIGRIPTPNLLRNGDFTQGLAYWTLGFDADSIPAANPNVSVVDDDFTDGGKAAQIVGVESVTETKTSLDSAAVFYPNRPFAWEPLAAGFLPGGGAKVDAVAQAMPSTAGLKVTIVGHTANDGTGSGINLSKRRAEAAAARVAAIRPGAVITTNGVGFYDPDPNYPIDSQQQRRVVISYASTTTVTAKSKQWIRQTVTVSQPKEARYPLQLTAGAWVKVTDSWTVTDANMVTVKLVARREDTPKVEWDSASASVSDTDPVDRWVNDTANVKIPADGRNYLVDVYLYAPAALARYTRVALVPIEMLYFWGVDQALIVKGVVEHMQDPAMGKQWPITVGTRTPLTGVPRDAEYPHYERRPVEEILDYFPGLYRGMDIDTIATKDEIAVATFYPRQGAVVDYQLVQGGNVANATPETTNDVGSLIIAQAQDTGPTRAEAYAVDDLALGGMRLERLITAEQETPINELDEVALAELGWARIAVTSYWVDIDPQFIAEVLAQTSKGDTVRLILDSPEQVDTLARIVKRQHHPSGLRLLVAVEA